MLLYLPHNTINLNNIYFGEGIKNTVIENGKFIRLIYSTHDMVLNGIYVHVPFNINKSSCNKYYFKFADNEEYKSHFINIEKFILDKHNVNKKKYYKLTEQLNQNSIKLFNYVESYNKIILKISGLWEDETGYGLTYKFICYS